MMHGTINIKYYRINVVEISLCVVYVGNFEINSRLYIKI